MSNATLRLERCYNGDDYTIGTLSLNGLKLCDTLEPKDRGLSDVSTLAAVKATKAFGKTAIPTGSYTVTLGVVSSRFKARNWAKANGGTGHEGADFLVALLDALGQITADIGHPAFRKVGEHLCVYEQDFLGCFSHITCYLTHKVTNFF